MHGTAHSWLSLHCLIVALFHQTGSQNLSEDDKLTRSSHYYDKNSLACAMFCSLEDTCTGVNHTKPAGCQCESDATLISNTNNDGAVEPPITPHKSGTHEPFAYVIITYKRLYWYGKSGTLIYETNLKLPTDGYNLEVDSAESPKTIYCIEEHPYRIYSFDILSGKLLKVTPARMKGLRAFKVDSHTGVIIWTTRLLLKRCTLNGQNTADLHEEYSIEDISIDRIRRHIYFRTGDEVNVISYDGSGLRKVLSQPVEILYYNEADETLYWLRPWYEEDGSRAGYLSQKQHPRGPERIILEEDELFCYSFTVHNQRIYCKSDIERGISVVTLDGQKLPNIGSDIILADTEAQVIFL